MLDPPIRKVYMVLPLNITSLITSPHFTEVCVILVMMHSILEVERIRLLIVMISTMSSNYSTNTSSSAGKAKIQMTSGRAIIVVLLSLDPM